jgi:hypothetical protein
MNMADHFDFELIMALAEGTLDPDEAQAAEAGLDDEAREELAIQRMAIAALAEMPEPAMSATERTTIRDAVRAELHVAPAPARTAPSAPVRPWYVRFMPALGAAAALLVVAGVGLSGLFPTGGDDAATSDAEDAVAAEAPTNRSELSGGFDAADGADSVDESAAATAESTMAAASEPVDALADSAASDDADIDASDAPAEEAEAGPANEAGTDDAGADLGFSFIPIGDTITSTPGEVEEVMTSAVERATISPLSILDAPAFFEAQPIALCWETAISIADEEGTAVAGVIVAGFGKLDGQNAEFYEFDRDPTNIIVVVAQDTCSELLTVVR